MSELISNSETPGQFIQNIERRSALLIQTGYEENSLGEREAVYEFQHMTFQEYLTAYAVTHRCYPGAAENDDLIAVLSPHLTNPNMREVIPLVAVRLPRFYPGRLADDLMEKMVQESSSYDQLRDILLQMVADEAALSPDTIDQMLKKCFSIYYCASDKSIIQQIAEGRNAGRLIARFQAMDQEENDGMDYHISVLNVLSGKIADPVQYYFDHQNDPDPRKRANAVSVLCCPIAFHILESFPQSDVNIVPYIKDRSYAFLNDESIALQQAALWALQDCGFVKSAEDWGCYLTGLAHYADRANQFFSVVGAALLPDEAIPFDTKTRLSDQGFQNILHAVENCPVELDSLYMRMVTLTFLAAVACEDRHDLASLFKALRSVREKHMARGFFASSFLPLYEGDVHRALEKTILDGDYSEARKAAVREHIKATEALWGGPDPLDLSRYIIDKMTRVPLEDALFTDKPFSPDAPTVHAGADGSDN